MNSSKLILVASALVMTVGGAFAQTAAGTGTAAPAPSTAKQTLSYKVTQGQKFIYKMNGTMSVQGSEGTLTGLTTITVEKADGQQIQVKTGSSQMVVSFGGQTINIPDSPPQYMTNDLLGKIIEIKGEDIQPGDYRVEAINSTVFAPTPVGVGDSWTVNYASDPKTGIVQTVGNYKVLGTETVDGISCLKISFDNQEKTGDVPGSSKGTVWVNPADGMMVKKVGDWTNLPIPASPMPVTGHFSIELIPAMSGGSSSSTTAAGS